MSDAPVSLLSLVGSLPGSLSLPSLGKACFFEFLVFLPLLIFLVVSTNFSDVNFQLCMNYSCICLCSLVLSALLQTCILSFFWDTCCITITSIETDTIKYLWKWEFEKFEPSNKFPLAFWSWWYGEAGEETVSSNPTCGISVAVSEVLSLGLFYVYLRFVFSLRNLNSLVSAFLKVATKGGLHQLLS